MLTLHDLATIPAMRPFSSWSMKVRRYCKVDRRLDILEASDIQGSIPYMYTMCFLEGLTHRQLKKCLNGVTVSDLFIIELSCVNTVTGAKETSNF